MPTNNTTVSQRLLAVFLIITLAPPLPAQSPAFRHYTTDHGLPSSQTYDIRQDDEGYIWIATDNGLSRFNGYEFENFGPEQGLKDNVVFKIYKDYLGRIWFCTMSGDLYRYERDSIMPYPHNAVIQQFQGRFDYLKYIHLDRNGALYAATRGAGLLKIFPDGRWKNLYTTVSFEIQSHIWLRWWFLSLVALFLAATGFAFYKNRITQLKRLAALQRLRADRAREKMEMEQEMNRLKQSALRAQINPHFIFNCLNSIQSFILEGRQDQAVFYLSRFARLMRLTLNFSLEPRISLEEEVRMLNTYLELEKMRFQDGFVYQIEVAENIGLFDTAIPPLLIQPYVENAIIHGLADATKDGQVRITYERKNGHLLATVTDNGIGITESKRRKSGQAALHHSVGMTITKKRLELLNPERQDDAVSVEELKGEHGEALGTRVTVRIG